MADMSENWHRYPVERPRHGGLYEVLYRNAGHLQAKDMVYAFGSKRFIASGRATDYDVMMWREIESELIPEETDDTELEKAENARQSDFCVFGGNLKNSKRPFYDRTDS